MAFELDIYHPAGEEYLPHQLVAIEEILLRNNVLLADEMGLGKTITLAGYINATFRRIARERDRHMHCLIIVPNSLRLNILGEFEKWIDPEFGRDFEQCTTAAFFDADIVVASYEGLTKWHRQLAKIEWDLIAVDEGHSFKNRSAKRTHALYYLTNNNTAILNDIDPEIKALIGDTDYKPKLIMMTGTPIPNYPYELFPLIHWLAPKEWPSAVTYNRRYCPNKKYAYHMEELQQKLRAGFAVYTGATKETIEIVEEGSRGFKCRSCGFDTDNEAIARDHVQTNNEHFVRINWGFGSRRNTQRIMTTTPGLMIRRLKKDVMAYLPKKRRQIIELPAEGELLELVQKERKLWEKHALLTESINKALNELTGEIAENDSTFENMIESLRAENRYAFEEIALIRHALARAKCPYVAEHLAELLENQEKIVVFAHHRDVIEAIAERFKDCSTFVYGGMNALEAQQRREKFWNDPSCMLFIGSMKVTKEGLNLQVAHNIVFAESDWVPGVLNQCEARCHRIGQEFPLLIKHLVAANSMDAYMLKKILEKQKTITSILDRKPKAVTV